MATVLANPVSHRSIYLLIGQSNMSGRAAVVGGDNPIGSRIWNIDGTNGRGAAEHPLHKSWGTGTPAFGLGGQFAIDMLATMDSDAQIILVSRAAGGTYVSDWQKNDVAGYYDDTLADINGLYCAGEVAAVCWHQGEADSKLEVDADAYQERLEQMISDWRADLGNATLPFVVGELCPTIDSGTYPYASTINAALAAVAAADSNVALVSSSGLTDLGDGVHFDHASQVTLGSRYATALQGL